MTMVRVRTPQVQGRHRIGRKFTQEFQSIDVSSDELKKLRADPYLAVELLAAVETETAPEAPPATAKAK